MVGHLLLLMLWCADSLLLIHGTNDALVNYLKFWQDAVMAVDLNMNADEAERLRVLRKQQELASRIASGEFTVSPRTDFLRNARRLLAHSGPLGRALAFQLATFEAHRRAVQAQTMPETRGDVGAIVGEPFFLPLYKLFKIYGGVFRLTFGPKVPFFHYLFHFSVCDSSGISWRS